MIKSFRVKNFKSLDVTVDLDPVTVLIGRSGSGKTNFVQALRFLRDFLLERKVDVAQQYGGWDRVFSASQRTSDDVMPFRVVFGMPGIVEHYTYDLVFRFKKGSATLEQEALCLGKKVLFLQENSKWIQEPAIVHVPQPAGPMLGALTGLQEASKAYFFLARGIGCYSFPEDVLSRTDNPTAKVTKNHFGFTDTGTNYLQALADILENLQTWSNGKEILAALKQLTSSVNALDLEQPGRNRVVVGHQVNGRVLALDLSQESAGFRLFLAHLIALYQTPPKHTLIFEEPERGIHPGALETLAEQFRACPEADRGQVILTTHSPQLLDHFAPEQIRVVEMDHSLTRIGPVSQDQISVIKDQLMRSGELLVVDPARIENCP